MKKLKNGFAWSIFLYSGLLFSENLDAGISEQQISVPQDNFEVTAVEVTPTQTSVAQEGSTDVPTKEQRDLYFRGWGYFVAHGSGMANLGLNSDEIEQILQGVKAAASGDERPWIYLNELEKAQQFLLQRAKEQIENTKKLAELFLKTKDSDPTIRKTTSGLRYKIIKEGDDVRADEDCTVEIDYEGRLMDGKIFDSTHERGEKASLYLGLLMPGFREAITLVGNGSEIQAFIPSELAYGDENVGLIPGGSVLDYTIKIDKIIKPTIEPDTHKNDPEINKEPLGN
ncbi:MAG: FKBP-type peptidyl-prolyl cis-trans isomerase [Puniceicoccales bacterium]|jgi:FKBP-type peptidyl-prolyl cis-trans isomerase|nr:FKBP-type peptidyl-prolyl cis-trans isomerase [Puniceicoccales bacterium]